MAEARDLVIIYNADGATLRGKLNYAFRKLSSSTQESPACAACDITHGGLSLSEVPKWKETKHEIESQGWRVLQWHRDEVEAPVKEWVTTQSVRYPTVLSRGASGEIKKVADSGELASCAGDATKLIQLLKEKGLMGASKSTL